MFRVGAQYNKKVIGCGVALPTTYVQLKKSPLALIVGKNDRTYSLIETKLFVKKEV